MIFDHQKQLKTFGCVYGHAGRFKFQTAKCRMMQVKYFFKKEKENENAFVICEFHQILLGPSSSGHMVGLHVPSSWESPHGYFCLVSVSGSHVCHFQSKAFNLNVRPSRTPLFPLPWPPS